MRTIVIDLSAHVLIYRRVISFQKMTRAATDVLSCRYCYLHCLVELQELCHQLFPLWDQLQSVDYVIATLLIIILGAS